MSTRGGRFGGMVTIVTMVGMGLLFLAFVVEEGRSINNPLPALSMLAGAGIFAAVFFGPVGRAIARMLDGDSRADDLSAMRLEDVEARLVELSLEQQRVGELEERLDFAERLLSKQAEPLREVRDGS